jgi:hypothetical protein
MKAVEKVRIGQKGVDGLVHVAGLGQEVDERLRDHLEKIL